MTLVAPEVAARPDLRTEPIYGTKYATVPMGAEVAAWERAPLPSGLGVPKPNRFLPRSLALKAPTDSSEAELKRPAGAARRHGERRAAALQAGRVVRAAARAVTRSLLVAHERAQRRSDDGGGVGGVP